MLLIVNPYASTVSDRLRDLVVLRAAGPLRGRRGRHRRRRGHATELCREAAARGLRRGRRLRRRRHRQRSRQRPARLPHPAVLPAGRLGERVREDARDPRRPGGRHRAPARAWPTTGARAGSTSGVVNGRCFTFASGLGLDASVVERVDSNPRLKARLGPCFFTWVAVAHVPAPLPASAPAAARSRPAGRTLRGRHRDRPERLALHLLPGPPDRDRRRRVAGLRRARRRRAAPRGARCRCSSIAWRAFSRARGSSGHRQVTGARRRSAS